MKRFFGAHAHRYSNSASHAHGGDLAALLDALGPRSTETALDVATGTGFTAVALAPLVRQVIGIDVTEEMLTEARRLAAKESLSNLKFELGDALSMRFPDASFDIVTTRRAAHHFKDVPRFLQEAMRVLKREGRLGIADMSPPDGAEAFANRIERLRDRSHMEAFAPGSWKEMVSGAGFRINSIQVLNEEVTLEKWLYPVASGGREEREIRLAWNQATARERELMGGDAHDGVVRSWTKSRVVLVASKAS